MRVGVELDGVALLEHGAHDARVLLGLASHDEERRLHPPRSEEVEDDGGPAGMRPVVERQHDPARSGRASHDGVDEHPPAEHEDPSQEKQRVARQRSDGPPERRGLRQDGVSRHGEQAHRRGVQRDP